MFKKFRAPSTEATKQFYANLSSGDVKRGLWGKEARFDPSKKSFTVNIDRHFVENIKPFVAKTDTVLDMGCGPGIFLVRAAPTCKKIIGVDVSKPFIDVAVGMIEKLQLQNATAAEIDGGPLKFDDELFDKVLMVDVIHHLENIDGVMNEVHRVLKKDGKLLIFEPNKLNPALFAMSLLDTNEWGLLSLGTKKAYDKILTPKFKIEHFIFCGLLIGPDSKLAFAIADFLLSPPFNKIFRFFSPKLFMVAVKI